MQISRCALVAFVAAIAINASAADDIHQESPRVRGGGKTNKETKVDTHGQFAIGGSSAEQRRKLAPTMIGSTIGRRGFPMYEPTDDDMGMRFSKVTFSGEIPEGIEDKLPLTAADFPLDDETASMLRESNCISVVRKTDCKECDMYAEELIEAVGGYPVHVSSDPDSLFWDDFRHVIWAQQQRTADVAPSNILPIPNIWKSSDLTLENVAEYVHDELPGTHHANMIREFVGEGFEVDRSIVPSLSSTEFLRREVMLSYLTTWAVNKVGPYNFATKYTVGRARPEEVAWKIAQGEFTEADGVPADVVTDIMSMNLDSQFSFTAYPEGSPAHPSWPAMHSAGSAASLYLPVILELSEEQICQTKLVDWAVSYARTVAGVHYPSDNTAGLNLGQEVIARKLPKHLEHIYGSDPDVVEAKVEASRFDWNNFMETDCYKKNYNPN